jgi:hypothetical protein
VPRWDNAPQAHRGCQISTLIFEKKYVEGVSITSSFGRYINGRNSANLELLIDKTSSLYLYMICSNIPASPAYGVYISQLIRYTRASSNYSDFLKRHLYLRNRLLDQGY